MLKLSQNPMEIASQYILQDENFEKDSSLKASSQTTEALFFYSGNRFIATKIIIG